jgi:hypothetical protein
MNALKTIAVAVIALLAAGSIAFSQTPAPVTGGKGCTP